MNVIAVSGDPAGSVIDIMKFSLEQAHILPFRRASTEYFPVPSPWILLQFGDGPYDFRTERVEMDILHDIEKISGFIYDRRLVAVLEEVPNAFVPLIEIFGISRQQASHEGRKGALIAMQ